MHSEAVDEIASDARVYRFKPENVGSDLGLPTQLLLWNILRVVRKKFGWSPCLCRIQVVLMTTHKFLGWMFCVRWMDERVAKSKKCWIVNERSDLNAANHACDMLTQKRD